MALGNSVSSWITAMVLSPRFAGRIDQALRGTTSAGEISMTMNFRPFLKIDVVAAQRRDHRLPVLLDHFGDRVGDRRRVRARRARRPCPGSCSSLVDGDRLRDVRLVVLGRELDLPTEHPALLVGVLDAELVAALNGLAQLRRRCRCWRTSAPILIGCWASALAAAPSHAETQRQPQGENPQEISHTSHDDVCPPHQRWLHGGVGKRGFAGASSSGQTITFLPSCHWNVSIVCPIWTPSRSTLNPP